MSWWRAAVAALRTPWGVAMVVAALAVTAVHLVDLGGAPPGLYSDEASIGYNAWSIAHHGVDEHGASFPLYFEAFGEYKNPLYIYLLAPFTWVLPLTPAVTRLPAALCGLGTVLALTLTAWTLFRNRAATLGTLLLAGLCPWLTLQSRVAFEVATMTLTLALAVWCYAMSTRPGAGRRWPVLTGVFLGLSVFAYSTGRLYVGLVVVLMLILRDRAFVWSRRGLAVVLPVLAAYTTLAVYGLGHRDALLGRFGGIGITSDSPGLAVFVARFVRNYATYWGVPYLFTNGDANPRHSTGYGGMLLVVTLPLLAVGLWACVRRRREPVPLLLLVMVVAGPVPAALTFDGTPHALRSAGMLPALLAIMVYGLAELLPVVRTRRLLGGVVAVAVAVDAGGFLWDLYARYPGRTETGTVESSFDGYLRAQNLFDDGEQAAIMVAKQVAGSAHHVWLSAQLDQPGEQALFALTPAPVGAPGDNDPAASQRLELESVGVTVGSDSVALTASSSPGDVLVLAPGEPPPAGGRLVETVDVSVAPDHVLPADRGHTDVVLAEVWQR